MARILINDSKLFQTKIKLRVIKTMGTKIKANLLNPYTVVLGVVLFVFANLAIFSQELFTTTNKEISNYFKQKLNQGRFKQWKQK